MIPRYKRKEISKIWEPENKFNIWLKIELLICEALSNRGDIPKDSFKTIKKNARFDIDRIDVIEKDVKHDVIAFLTNIGENIGHDSRFVHMGVTSSDIIDTAFSIQLKQSCSVLKRELKRLLNNLKVKSLNFKNTACIGRSHGIFAEPTTFGLKMLGKYCEFERHYKRLCDAEKQISICSISGAVGTYANIDPSIESFVAKKT
jgi:adenylosuccinate lyase